jgi:uncharacterized membrane protein HdeD (DUF308 family)
MTAAEMTQEGRATPWWLVLLQGIASIIVGIFLLTSPGVTTFVLIQVLGIFWMVGGVLQIVSIFWDSTLWGWKLFVGILGILAGIVILQHPLWATVLVPTILVLVIGIQGIISGVVQIFMAFRGGGWGIGILGGISVFFGLILTFNSFVAAAVLPWVLGIFAVVGGVFALVQAFRMR